MTRAWLPTVAVLAATLFAAQLSATAAPTASQADTRLIDQFGRPVSASELGGHWLLVYFGYAGCRDICPAALTSMSAVLNRLGPAGDTIQPLFVSLDPSHDSPQVLRAFAAHFHPRLRALTGSAEAVADAARTFNVPWKTSPQGTIVDHGTLFYLAAPDGRVVQVLHPGQPPADMAASIRAHVSAAAK